MSRSELRDRQYSFAVCCGMPDAVVAGALGLTVATVTLGIDSLLLRRGMESRMEFALQQNAAVRELRYPEQPVKAA